MKKILSIAMTTFLVASLAILPVSASGDRSPNTPPKATTSTTTATDKTIKPIKTYKVATEKSYALPKAIQKTGNTYSTSDATILTVDIRTTGSFKTLKNGSA